MTSLTTTFVLNDTISGATHPDTVVTQEKSKGLYFQRHINREYKSSSEGNPNLEVAWSIFGKHVTSSEYKTVRLVAMLHGLGQVAASSELSLLPEQINYLMSNLQIAGAPLSSEYVSEEDSLFIPEYRERGLTMNWKRARELRQKLAEQRRLAE